MRTRLNTRSELYPEYRARWQHLSVKERKDLGLSARSQDFRDAQEFWKLENHLRTDRYVLAQTCGYADGLARGCRDARLIYVASRVERGLINYDHCTTKELRLFYSARHVSVAEADAYDTERLITTLELADEKATFTRFLDLPPELREYVCQRYFESFQPTSTLVMSRLPPLCETSSLVRQESSLLFYGTRRFQVGMTWEYSWDDLNNYNVQLLPLTRNFFRAAQQDFTRSLRKLSLIMPNEGLRVDIDIPIRDSPAKVEVEMIGYWPEDDVKDLLALRYDMTFSNVRRLVSVKLQE